MIIPQINSGTVIRIRDKHKVNNENNDEEYDPGQYCLEDDNAYLQGSAKQEKYDHDAETAYFMYEITRCTD